jgi:hypothetical protein
MKKDFYIVYTADKEYLFGADTFTECESYCQQHDINGTDGEYIAEGILDTKWNDFEMTGYYSIPRFVL